MPRGSAGRSAVKVVLVGALILVGCTPPERLTGPLEAGAQKKRPSPGPNQPRSFRLASVSAGGIGTCGVDSNGAAYCWGYPVGNRSFTRRAVPDRVSTRTAFAQVDHGVGYACGLSRREGALYCWGDNHVGQFGNGVISTTSAPVRAGGKRTYVAFATGESTTCALTDRGEAYCMGDNFSAQLGNGTVGGYSTIPVLVSDGHQFTQITVGRWHACGLTEKGEAYCWGDNFVGQLGDGTWTSSGTPTPSASGFAFVRITAGAKHTCALDASGTAFCWGRNPIGQLGIGAFGGGGPSGEGHALPTPVAGGLQFEDIDAAAGQDHACAVEMNGQAYCWGAGTSGQLGDGAATDRHSPVPVAAGFPFASVTAGALHSCGIRASNSAVYCWGDGSAGQLGNGLLIDATVPAPVKQP